MITLEQQEKIEFYKSEFLKNRETYSSYGSDRVAHFGVYESQSDEDKNITIVQNVITDMSDDFQLYSEVMAFLIEPNGSVIDLFDVYPATDVNEYTKKLKKLM